MQVDVQVGPVSGQDAEALLAVVVELERVLVTGPAPELVARLGRRLGQVGLVDEGDGPAGLRLALADLNQRVRHALGEYESPLEPETGLVAHHVVFGTDADASRFCDEARTLGLPCRREDDDTAQQVRVIVSTTELWPSPAFDSAQERIERAATSCGGRYQGFGAPTDVA